MTTIRKIGHLIQQRRDHIRITQKQLAYMADIGINTSYKIVTGQANSTLESLQKVTDVLGMEITIQEKKGISLNETGHYTLHGKRSRYLK